MEAIDTTKDCQTNLDVGALASVPPAIPADFSVPDPECSGTLCSISRQIFIPSVTELPSMITLIRGMRCRMIFVRCRRFRGSDFPMLAFSGLPRNKSFQKLGGGN